MTILSELVALYERRAARENWPRPGFSTEKIGAEIVLAPDGQVVAIRSLMAPDTKGKMHPRLLSVPTPPLDRRGLKIVAGTFWDPMPYALGIGGTPEFPDFQSDRAPGKFEAFVRKHNDLLQGTSDPWLAAFLGFLNKWDPSLGVTRADVLPLIGKNVVFGFEDGRWLHDLPAARALIGASDCGNAVMCLVTGHRAPVARLHSPLKGVDNAQSGGAYLVSFNIDSAESHGKLKGDNAPTSDAAAVAYGTALNALLSGQSGHRLRHGDATMVFWARGDSVAAEIEAEDTFGALMSMRSLATADDTTETHLRAALVAIAQGKIPQGSALDPVMTFFILGLSPNAARLSVRFWHVDTLGSLAQRVTRFWEECAILPSPFLRGGVERMPRPAALLYDVAALHDGKNISPNLAGDLMRAVLTGQRYPATLLPAVIGRLRAEAEPDRQKHGDVDGRRAALIRALLIRNYHQEVPMALNESEDDIAYLLGRLFGAYVYAERSYQDRGASLRSKYMGSASATPARIFPVLMRGYEHNRDALRKAGGFKAGSGVKADKAVAAILDRLPGGVLPPALPLEDQGRFFVGFYHQLSAFFAKAEDAVDDLIEPEDPSDNGDAE